MAKKHERSKAREIALQALYSGEMTEKSPLLLIDEGLFKTLDPDLFVEGVEASDYALRLLAGVEEHCDELDAYVETASQNWAVSRMPVVDRCVLRLAVYEMLYEDDVPLSVSIDEAVQLAKDFGGEDDSHRFVNGVLGSVNDMVEEGREPEALAFADGE